MELLTYLRQQWDRALAVLSLVVGVVMIVVGWVGVSSTEYITRQIPYVVSGGIGGIVVLMVGGTLWLSADLSDEWRALTRLEARQLDFQREIDERLQALTPAPEFFQTEPLPAIISAPRTRRSRNGSVAAAKAK